MSLTNAKMVSLKDQLAQDERDLKAEAEAAVVALEATKHAKQRAVKEKSSKDED